MSAVVLVHGAGGNAATWGPCLAPWSGVPLTVVDLPGRGATAGPPLADVPALARWLAATIAGLDRPVVVGHSLGGAVALQLALDHPDAVAGIVLVSSAARLRVAPAILEAVDAATAERPFRIDLAFGVGTDPAVVEAYAQTSASVPPGTTAADWRACDAFDVRDRLGAVRTPALVVYGAEDRLTPPRHQVSLAEALRAERVEVPGAAHMLPWERPGELATAVLGWR